MSLRVFKSPDKDFHEKWDEDDLKEGKLLNFPHPHIALILGPVNSGKTSLVKNLLVEQRPDFQKVFVLSSDPGANEYSDIAGPNFIVLEEIPDVDVFDRNFKQLLILEDIVFSTMKKVDKERLHRLVCHISTHRNLSIYITGHDYFTIPTIIRRQIRLMILFKFPYNALMESHVGYPLSELWTDFGQYDSLWIDKTGGPELRINGYKIIKLK